MRLFSFSELKDAPLIVDAIYEGGTERGIATEPLHILLPRTSNQGGFRITHRADDMSKPAYVVIFTSMEEQEWPDQLDVENGVFRYYGDNRHPGTELHDTRKKGNKLLRDSCRIVMDKTDNFIVYRFLRVLIKMNTYFVDRGADPLRERTHPALLLRLCDSLFQVTGSFHLDWIRNFPAASTISQIS